MASSKKESKEKYVKKTQCLGKKNRCCFHFHQLDPKTQPQLPLKKWYFPMLSQVVSFKKNKKKTCFPSKKGTESSTELSLRVVKPPPPFNCQESLKIDKV